MNNCLIKTVQSDSLCGVLLLKRGYFSWIRYKINNYKVFSIRHILCNDILLSLTCNSMIIIFQIFNGERVV